MMLEALRLLTPHHPYADALIFVEFYEVDGISLLIDEAVVMYNPDTLDGITIDSLCRILSEVFHMYGMNVTDIHGAPPGTVLH